MKTTTTLLSLSLGLLLAACSADAEPDEAAGTPAADSAATAPPASSGGEVSVSCSGAITRTSLSTSVGIRCVDGPPGTFGCGDPCAPQDITIRYEPPASRCGSVDLFAWDGTTCITHKTNQGGQMKCTGADCEKLYATEAACTSAYASCPAR